MSKPKVQWDTYVMDVDVTLTGSVAVRARSAKEAERHILENIAFGDLDSKACVEDMDDPRILSEATVDNGQEWDFHVDEDQEEMDDDEDAEYEDDEDEEADPLGD